MKAWMVGVLAVTVVVSLVLSVMALLRQSVFDASIQELRETTDGLRTLIAAQHARETEKQQPATLTTSSDQPMPNPDTPGESETLPVTSPDTDEEIAETYEPVDVVLAIDAEGRCTLDGQAVEREALAETLKATLRTNPAMTLIVEPDPALSMAEVNEIIETANKAGINRLQLHWPAESEEASE